MPYPCFFLESTNRCRRALRRYVLVDEPNDPRRTCSSSGIGYHNAEVLIEDGTYSKTADGFYRTEPSEMPHDDPRWASHCICGYEFRDADAWQLFWNPIYRRVDTGSEMTLRDAAVGAMYDATWLHQLHGYRVIDGMTLVVKLPGGGEWVIDGESQGGGYWNRTGKPPKITVRRSILASHYHGWLTDGVLSDDLDGRRYDK